MCCPRGVICHGLSLCTAAFPASCFITPHLLTVFFAPTEAGAEVSETDHSACCLSSCCITGNGIWKSKSEATPKQSSLTINTDGNFLACLPQNIFYKAISGHKVLTSARHEWIGGSEHFFDFGHEDISWHTWHEDITLDMKKDYWRYVNNRLADMSFLPKDWKNTKTI